MSMVPGTAISAAAATASAAIARSEYHLGHKPGGKGGEQLLRPGEPGSGPGNIFNRSQGQETMISGKPGTNGVVHSCLT